MIKSFKNKGTEDIFYGRSSKAARKVCPTVLRNVVSRKLDQLDSVTSLTDLSVPPKNMLEALKNDRLGQYSIRINNQYRICFKWADSGPEEVEIVDYH